MFYKYKYHFPDAGFAGGEVGISRPLQEMLPEAEILPVAFMFEVQVIIP